ncbi:MAG: hypothetical protein IJ083_04850 [Clostridia bacterium]|nr:hypothetical protein [Clostridia bacterium]
MNPTLSSSADARKLYYEYVDYVHMANEIQEDLHRLQIDVVNQITRVNKDSQLQKLVESILSGASNADIDISSTKAKEFIRDFVWFVQCSEPFEEAKKKDAFMADSLTILKKAASPIQWVLMDSDHKAQAKDVYRILLNWVEADYGKDITTAYETLYKKNNTYNTYDVITDLQSDLKKYLAWLFRIQGYKQWPCPWQEMIDQSQQIIEKARQLEKTSNNELYTIQLKIKKQAADMVMENIHKQLETMEVDQLSGVNNSLLIKLLRDYGYTTVERVYVASLTNLISITSISLENAHQIKDAAEEIVAGLKNKARIRLNASDRNENETALVLLTCRYIHTSEITDRLSKHIVQSVQPMETAIQRLKPLNSTAAFILVSRSKQLFQQAYQELHAPHAELEKSILEASQSHQWTESEAWEDFSVNSVTYNTILQKLIPEYFKREEQPQISRATLRQPTTQKPISSANSVEKRVPKSTARSAVSMATPSNQGSSSWGDDSWMDVNSTPIMSKGKPSSSASTDITAEQLQDIQEFPDVDAFIRYLNDEEITYVDKRSEKGCLWVLSSPEVDAFIKIVRIQGRKLYYSTSPKALGNYPGWFYS